MIAKNHTVHGFCLWVPISVKHQIFCPAVISVITMYLQSNLIIKLRDLIKLSLAMACVVEGYYRLCYQRIPHLHWCLVSCIGEVLQCCCDVHNCHGPLAFWVRQPSSNDYSFEVLEERHRIKKSQAQNCDTCSELKQKCDSNCRIKICEPMTACIICTN